MYTILVFRVCPINYEIYRLENDLFQKHGSPDPKSGGDPCAKCYMAYSCPLVVLPLPKVISIPLLCNSSASPNHIIMIPQT